MISFDDQNEAARPPPWEIERPQGALVCLADGGEIQGRVLDVGCGTGENALFLAARAFPVIGVDGSPAAVEQARAKKQERGLAATFLLTDALDLSPLHRTFETVIDSGLFHTLDDVERIRYARSLRQVTAGGSRLHLLCFSELEPPWGGPRRVTQEEIRETFDGGWRVQAIRPALFETTRHRAGAQAWLATIERRAFRLARTGHA